MSEAGHPASSWDHHTDSELSSSHNHQPYRQPAQPQPYYSRESLEAHLPPPTPTKSASPPSSTVGSPTRQTYPKWQDSAYQVTSPPPISPQGGEDGIVDSSFDESVLRALCDLDCAVPLLLDRIKQGMASCREASVFFKKRAILEDEYGRSMLKLAKNSVEVYAMNEGKAGSYVSAWQSAMKTHETVANNRIRFAARLNEMSEELAKLSKEVDAGRKQQKDLASRYERALQESESATEKAKAKVDATVEELERVLIQKEGESLRDTGVQGRSPGGIGGKRVIGKAVQKGGMLLKGRNPGNIQRQEDDIRARMSTSSDAYKKNVTETQHIRNEYFNFQLPRILRALKEAADEIDLGTQYHLTRYAFLYEATLLEDGATVTPVNEASCPSCKTSLPAPTIGGPQNKPEQSLKSTFEAIDNRTDFKNFMQHYVYAHPGTNGRAPRREPPRDEGLIPAIPPPLFRHGGSPGTTTSQVPVDRGRPTFGVDLAEQMARDDVDVPPIMVKCCEAIEKWGLDFQGIYRVGGNMKKVGILKEKLDKDLDGVNLDADEFTSEISIVTSVLKLWLRELPDPLLTHDLYERFLEAARHDMERLRQIRLHEQVNELPDPNYATLKYFLGHLHRITQHESVNQMSVQNIAIVFGPTLFGTLAGSNGHMNGMQDAGLQNKAIETILEHYTDIFVDENDG